MNPLLDINEEYDVYMTSEYPGFYNGDANSWMYYWFKHVYPFLERKSYLLIYVPNWLHFEAVNSQYNGFIPKNINPNVEIKWIYTEVDLFLHQCYYYANDILYMDYFSIHDLIERKFIDTSTYKAMAESSKGISALVLNASRVHMLDNKIYHFQYHGLTGKTQFGELDSILDKCQSFFMHSMRANSITKSALPTEYQYFDLHEKSRFNLTLLQNERAVLKRVKNVYHVGFENIPELPYCITNPYEWIANRPLSNNTRVGFTATTEFPYVLKERVWLLKNTDSILFTKMMHLKDYEKTFYIKFKNSECMSIEGDSCDVISRKPYNVFSGDDWGIFHGANYKEVFGYNICKALDYGKLPIIGNDILNEVEYPYRATTVEEFDVCIARIKAEDYNSKLKNFNTLKNYVIAKTEANAWKRKLLEIYND